MTPCGEITGHPLLCRQRLRDQNVVEAHEGKGGRVLSRVLVLNLHVFGNPIGCRDAATRWMPRVAPRNFEHAQLDEHAMRDLN